MQRQDRESRFGFAHLIIGLAVAGGVNALAQGQPAPADTLRLGLEAWGIVVGAAVTIGVSLEQLRRARSDVKDVNVKLEEMKRDNARDIDHLITGNDRKHGENSKKFDGVERRLGHIEDTLQFIRRPH